MERSKTRGSLALPGVQQVAAAHLALAAKRAADLALCASGGMFAMSAVALAFPDPDDFDWLAPVPQPFTRCEGRAFWPSDRRYRPLLLSTRLTRDLRFLIERLPRELAPLLRERFKPTRGPLVWDVPPALPTNLRQPYAQAFLTSRTDEGLCAEVTLTAGLIERLLNAPEGMVGGLTHTYLLLMQLMRLRQLWPEVQRRAWAEEPLAVLAQALG